MNPYYPHHYASTRHNYDPSLRQRYHQPSMENYPGRTTAPRHSGGGIPFYNVTNLVPHHRLPGSFNSAGYPAGPPLGSSYVNGGMHVASYPTPVADVGVGFGYAPLPIPTKAPILAAPPKNRIYAPYIPNITRNTWPTAQIAPPQVCSVVPSTFFKFLTFIDRSSFLNRRRI